MIYPKGEDNNQNPISVNEKDMGVSQPWNGHTFSEVESYVCSAIDLLSGRGYIDKPLVFFIDQRASVNNGNSDAMISPNYIQEDDGSLTMVSACGKEGSYYNNALVRIRKGTHCYKVTYDSTNNKMKLKQVKDDNRRQFLDGSAVTGNDLVIKLDQTVYWKVEPAIPAGESTKNANYLKVTIQNCWPSDVQQDNISGKPFESTLWNVWDKDNLVSVYKTPLPLGDTETENGAGMTIQAHTFFALLYYGWYGTTDSTLCGTGTKCTGTDGYAHKKQFGINDAFGMTDTTKTEGSSKTATDAEIVAGSGENIKTPNFWGLEGFMYDYPEILPFKQISAFPTDKNFVLITPSTKTVTPYSTSATKPTLTSTQLLFESTVTTFDPYVLLETITPNQFVLEMFYSLYYSKGLATAYYKGFMFPSVSGSNRVFYGNKTYVEANLASPVYLVRAGNNTGNAPIGAIGTRTIANDDVNSYIRGFFDMNLFGNFGITVEIEE